MGGRDGDGLHAGGDDREAGQAGGGADDVGRIESHSLGVGLGVGAGQRHRRQGDELVAEGERATALQVTLSISAEGLARGVHEWCAERLAWPEAVDLSPCLATRVRGTDGSYLGATQAEEEGGGGSERVLVGAGRSTNEWEPGVDKRKKDRVCSSWYDWWNHDGSDCWDHEDADHDLIGLAEDPRCKGVPG